MELQCREQDQNRRIVPIEDDIIEWLEGNDTSTDDDNRG